MKKNMIALAVAGALVAPVAMADVTVSGGLQAELVQIGGNGSQPNGLYAADAFQTGKENSGNYGFLKFSATEDLGGDMKALAVYNLNANVGDSSKAGLDTREAYVGLSAGAYGAVLAGTLPTPYKSSTVGWDPMLATSFQARGNGGMSILHNSYASNALAYANSFAGGMVSVVAALVLDESKSATSTDKTTGKHAKSFSVNVKPISGLDIALAYIDVTKFGDLSTLGLGLPAVSSDKDANATKIGVKYSMGPFTVAYQHEMINKGLTATGEKGNVDYLTGSFKFDDANTINVAVGKSSKKIGALADAGKVDFTGATPVAGGPADAGLALTTSDKDTKYMAIDFNHAFSKNTSVFVGYRVTDAGDATVTTVDLADATVSPIVKTNVATKESAIGAGLRVNF